ncbi:hypothetical protein [Mesorhizobium sp. M0207]|uniref:hypothetical protein n=1 Tax=Mesorhizobium sp. M0207 TaxID=2956915 RepID=UPI003339D9A4
MTRMAIKLASILLFVLATSSLCNAENADGVNPAAFARTLVNAANGQADFARAKLAVDRFVDPSINEEAALGEIDAMVVTVNKMLRSLPPDAAPTSMEKMKALRAFLYEELR